MTNYDENDLINDDYIKTTTTGDNPNYTGIKDQKKVSKKELYEVIWFCDAFVKNYNVPKTKESFQKVEKLLRLQEAKTIIMRDELNEFVAKNWNKGLV